MDSVSGEATRLLVDLRSGNKDAESKLLALLYKELRRLAASYLRWERPDHTLQPTALINEAYLRIIDLAEQNWENRAHFLGVCARIMRRILVDHARQRNAAKRGGKEKPLRLDDAALSAAHRPVEFVALDEALSRLEEFDPRQSRVVELRFFAGMSEEEISHVLGVSVRTIKRDWNVARAWLYSEMTK